MTGIRFENVSFSYPETERNIFNSLSLSLPKGIVSLIGQNGTGKSTLLLLSGGSVLPSSGRVTIRGIDTVGLRNERTRQKYVSFVFQNMEFETEESIGDLLWQVYENGFHKQKKEDFIAELVKIFELEPVLAKKTQAVSKGELQRTILAFSLLYGSQILLMDEPVFALEDYQKERAMDFVTGYAKEENLSIYYSVHELELSRKYSDYILLFFKDSAPLLGPTREIFNRKTLEKAYEIPYVFLYKKEALYRKNLFKLSSKSHEPSQQERLDNELLRNPP